VKSAFDDVIQDVISRCPSVDLPWLDTAVGLANIQAQTVDTSTTRSHYKCEQSADNKQADDTSTDDDSSELPSKQVTDYSHLYIYKSSSAVAAAQSRATAEYIALSSSSSSSDEGENDCLPLSVANADVASIHDTRVTAVVDTAPAAGIQRTRKRSRLYRTANTGVQIANPNKKRKK